MNDDLFVPPGGEKYLFVQPNMERFAVLGRVTPEEKPDFVTTARTRCLWCDYWCWLGDKTMEFILAGEAAPMCLECATDLVPGNAVAIGELENTAWERPA
jgi:hypothetical protein